ncbi:MAG: hypothetical protein RL154_1596, partial [Pseudomonadota bacterium]
MKLLSYVYINQEDLHKFIADNKIENSTSILVQLFYSNQDIQTIYSVKDILMSALSNASIIGTSTAGIIQNGSILDSSIVISFSMFSSSITKAISFCDTDIDVIIDKLSNSYINNKTKLMIVFANTFRFNSTEFLAQLTNKFPEVVIVGGNSSDDFKFESVFTFSTNCSDCDVALAFVESDVLSVSTKYLLHWLTLGKDMKVTKALGSTVYEINNRTAIDTYKYYLGKEISDNLLQHGIEFPLIYKDKTVDVARAAVSFDTEIGSITFAGEIPQGANVKFGYANIQHIENQNKHIIKNEFSVVHEAIYIYSCAARRQMLGNFLSEEIASLNQVAPTSGFVTYGEFFHDQASCINNLLNITTTYVVLDEEKQNKKIDFISHNVAKDKKDVILKALTTLVSRTSDELEESINYLEQFQNTVNEASIFSITDEYGFITLVNKNFEAVSGYKAEELIGKTHNIVRHPDMQTEFFTDMWQTIQSGKAWKGLVKNRRKDGKPYHVLSQIAPIYYKDGSFREYIGIRNDVTELEEYKSFLKHELDTTSKNLEENLHYATQYENAINSTTAIIKTDTNNIITYVNDKMCEMSEYSRDELIGMNCQKLRHSKHIISKTCDRVSNQLSNKIIVSEVLTNISKSNKEYTVSNLFYPILDLHENVKEHLLIMHDITEILKLTEEIVNTQKEVVLTMGAIGETRSKETGLHVKRVAEYSYLLAILYGLSEQEANLLKQASPMH